MTGANGFIGSWLVRKLTERGHNVRILARPTSDLSELAGLPFDVASGDVTRPETLVAALKNIEVVFNLAGLIAYKKAERSAMEAVNIAGTKNLLLAMDQSRVNRLVHMSSVVTIGASFTKTTPLNEDSVYNLAQYNFGYFETKRAAEKLVQEWHNSRRGEAIIYNPSTVYGPGDARKSSRKTQLKVARGEFNFYTSGGVSIAHVDDVAQTLVYSLDRPFDGERYILAGENITIKQLFDFIANIAGQPPPRIKIPNIALQSVARASGIADRLGLKLGLPGSETILVSQMYHWYDSSKAIAKLAYRIRPAESCIRDSVQWMEMNNFLAPSRR